MANRIIAEPTWLEYGVDVHVYGDNDPIHGVQGNINQCSRTTWDALQQLGINDAVDTIIAEYKDAAAITLQAGGICWADDGEQAYLIDTNVDVSMSSDLTTDDTEANDTHTEKAVFILHRCHASDGQSRISNVQT